MRSQYGQFPRVPHLGRRPRLRRSASSWPDAFATVLSVFEVLEGDRAYRNLNPKCEPQLGKRGLYSAMGGSRIRQLEMAMLWVLNLSDGRYGLLDIAERSGLPFEVVHEAAQLLLRHDLLAPCEDAAGAGHH